MTSHASKHALLLSALALPAALSAQSTDADTSFFASLELTDLVLVMGLVLLVGALIVILRVLGMIIKLEEVRMLREKGLDEVAAHYAQPKHSMMATLWKKLVGRASVSEERDLLLDHNYDGIQELDNKLPPWWLGMFYASLIFAPIYLYVYHGSDLGLSSAEEYELEMETASEDVAAFLSTQADQIDETNVELMTDASDLSAGEAIFKLQCVVCHGQFGEGTVGPNFTDEYWVHGGDIKDLFRTIKYGVPEKGMISWTSLLRPSEMQQVASFILTLQGTDPPNQKDPEGELWIAPAVEATPADTTTQGE